MLSLNESGIYDKKETSLISLGKTNLRKKEEFKNNFVCLFVCFFLFQALALDSSNRAVQDQLRILKEKERKHDEKLSKALGAMFGRKM